jgi:cysteinyl-tRNA synthetase
MQAKLHLYNTLTRKLDEFVPVNPEKVTLYTCGPTVYHDAHIGNMKIYLEWDLLTRTLKYLGYNVVRVMNATDVGQMTSDEDFGEDKMMKAVKRERANGNEMTAQQIADLYTTLFMKDAHLLNMEDPTILSPATKHIPEMIELIKKLEEKGYAYKTEHAVYFDVYKFPEYTKLSKQKLEENETGVRDEVVVDPQKRHPADFRLWQLDQESVMMWDSPWGKGFPGWHIECSAMAMKYLGETIDIHTGGVDHIPVHHTNEIAQSEAATGKPFAHYWLHGEFLKVDNKKMSKSAGTFYVLRDIVEKGFDPLDFRYFALQAHYRYPQNFSWEAMEAAREARLLLKEQVTKWQSEKTATVNTEVAAEYKQRFSTFLANDINVPGAVGVLWEVVKATGLNATEKLLLVEDFDKVFGLNLLEKSEFSAEVYDLIAERDSAKNAKDFTRADEIRNRLTELGVRIIDTPTGSIPVKA